MSYFVAYTIGLDCTADPSFIIVDWLLLSSRYTSLTGSSRVICFRPTISSCLPCIACSCHCICLSACLPACLSVGQSVSLFARCIWLSLCSHHSHHPLALIDQEFRWSREDEAVPGWLLPADWTTDEAALPRRGLLQLTYLDLPPGRNLTLRKSLCAMVRQDKT